MSPWHRWHAADPANPDAASGADGACARLAAEARSAKAGAMTAHHRHSPKRMRARPSRMLGILSPGGDPIDDLSRKRQTDAARGIVDAAPREREVAAARARVGVQLLECLGALRGRKLREIDARDRQRLRAGSELELLRLIDFFNLHVDGESGEHAR